MKKFATLLALLLCFAIVKAQDTIIPIQLDNTTRVNVDAAADFNRGQPAKAKPLIWKINDSLSVPSDWDTVLIPDTKQKEIDEQINEGFQPITDAVVSIIFYSISLGTEVMYDKDDSLQSAEFYSNPPFKVVYDQSTPNKDKVYKLKLVDENRFSLFVEGTNDKGFETWTTKTYNFDEPIKDGDFEFKIVRNPESNAKLLAGSVYQFKVEEVKLILVVVYLIVGALFFTLAMRFVNFRKFRLAIDIVRGKYSDPNEDGEVSHFQALTAALSGTVGLGNIAGVAVAISIGGPGATFWMIVAGLLGMSSKFVECTLGVKYRIHHPDGSVGGGPMHYLSRGLKARGMGTFGTIAAGFFAVMCVGGSFGGGNMFQANQAFSQLNNSLGGAATGLGYAFGIVVAIVVAAVIIGGIKSIGKVTEKIVPFMVGVYVLAALIILGAYFNDIPAAVGAIFSGAFSPVAISGGIIGVLIQGFKRAAFSNEAGVGSASIAHSAVKTNNPASEGIVALLEPFIDTVVVCTMTALVIIITGNAYNFDSVNGVVLTSTAFSSVFPWFEYILTIAVVLFAFSTMLSWSYYGLQSWKYLFGESQVVDITYKVLFCVFVVIGSASSLGSVIDFSDAMIFAMAIPNVIGLIIMRNEAWNALNDYVGKIKRGEIIRH